MVRRKEQKKAFGEKDDKVIIMMVSQHRDDNNHRGPQEEGEIRDSYIGIRVISICLLIAWLFSGLNQSQGTRSRRGLDGMLTDFIPPDGRTAADFQKGILDAGCRWSALCVHGCFFDISHGAAIVGVLRVYALERKSRHADSWIPVHFTRIKSIRRSGRTSTMSSLLGS